MINQYNFIKYLDNKIKIEHNAYYYQSDIFKPILYNY